MRAVARRPVRMSARPNPSLHTGPDAFTTAREQPGAFTSAKALLISPPRCLDDTVEEPWPNCYAPAGLSASMGPPFPIRNDSRFPLVQKVMTWNGADPTVFPSLNEAVCPPVLLQAYSMFDEKTASTSRDGSWAIDEARSGSSITPKLSTDISN